MRVSLRDIKDDLGRPMSANQIDLEDARNAKRGIHPPNSKINPSSPSHPANLYGSATAMTTNWDW